MEIIEERATPAGPVTKHFFPQGEIRYSSTGTPSKYYYTKDHLGSLREVLDANGSIVARYDYDPFGVPTQTLGSIQFDFLYTGHFHHWLSGLILAPYRAYNPEMGRWLSREPLDLDGPNLYHYVFNNPINSIDPTGLKTYQIILFDPADGGGKFVDSIPDQGTKVHINNVNDLEWFFNNRVQDGDRLEAYGHGGRGFATIGLDGGKMVYGSDLKVNRNCPKVKICFYSCNFAEDNPNTSSDEFLNYAAEWSRLFNGATVEGWTGTIQYGKQKFSIFNSVTPTGKKRAMRHVSPKP